MLVNLLCDLAIVAIFLIAGASMMLDPDDLP